LKMDSEWTVPAVEFGPGRTGEPAVLLISDLGRAGCAEEAGKLVEQGRRVIVIDPFYFGESKIKSRDFLFALLVAAVGERPIGIQASQVAAAARWAGGGGTGVHLVALGPRSSTFALIAAALEEKAIGSVELGDRLTSLKQVIEENWSVDKTPELFCFGLLEQFDLEQIEHLVKPRNVIARKSKTE
jgi:hypothetical protein